jgi:hypothetical protein
MTLNFVNIRRLLLCIISSANLISSLNLFPTKLSPPSSLQHLPVKEFKRGIIDYIGNTSSINVSLDESTTISSVLSYQELNSGQLFKARFNLWRQLPWKKFKKNTILKNIAQLKGLTIVAIKSIEYGSIFPLRRLTLLKVPFAPILSCLLNYPHKDVGYTLFSINASKLAFTLGASSL